MKKSTKAIITLIFALSISSQPVLAAEPSTLATTISTDSPANAEDYGVSPCIVHSYSKTVQKSYVSYDEVEASISYSEYNYSSWFSGTLYLKSVYQSSSGYWIATYTGSLVGLL